MTSEERLDRIQDLLARWIEQSRKDQEENRILWRESRDQIEATAKEMRTGFAEVSAQQRETDRILRASSQAANERVDKLVSAIGEFIRVKGNGSAGSAGKH